MSDITSVRLKNVSPVSYSFVVQQQSKVSKNQPQLYNLELKVNNLQSNKNQTGH
jgi:hypothetical protein